MDELKEFAKTRDDVRVALHEKNLFPDHNVARPVSLADACRMDMSSLAEGGAKIGWPATAWWWYAEVTTPSLTPTPLPSLMCDLTGLLPADLQIRHQEPRPQRRRNEPQNRSCLQNATRGNHRWQTLTDGVLGVARIRDPAKRGKAGC